MCPECGDSGEGGRCATDQVARAPVGSDTLLGTTIGSWRIASVIGAGGMGRVYKAVQPAIGARVAIKVLKRECAADPDLVERFFNEARAVNLIRHDNIVDVIDLGRLPDGAPYIVMEFLEGASLAALFKRDPKLPVGAVARLVDEVLAALEVAHAKGIIHRDLKPDNVFVSPSGRVTVLDFGIAKLATAEGANPTQTGSLLGTPAYMSPEQARAQPLDARSDLYSTGVILYEGATGSPPFSAASLYEMLDMQVKAAPAAPRTKNPAIPARLEKVILKALAKDPAERFATADEMRRAIEEAIQGMPSEQLALPSINVEASGPSSDPFAATAASTQASLARGETRPSASPEQPRAAVQRSRQRGGVIAVVGLAGIVVGASVVFLRRTRSDVAVSAPAPPVLETDAGRIVIAAPPKPLDLVTDAAAVVPEPPRDAAVIASEPSDAAERARAADAKATSPSTTVPSSGDGTVPLHVASPRAFDPAAYITTVTQVATRATGRVVLTGVNWHGFDRRGLIDLTQPHAGAQYTLISIDRIAAKDPSCILLAEISASESSLSIGHMEGGECSGRRVVVHCSLTELWKRAEAQGLPASVTTGGANYNHGYWYFSSPQAPDFTADIPDDCP